MSAPQPNLDQAIYWNSQAGPRWVAMQRDLDAELAPFGIVAMNKLGLAFGDRVLDVGCGAGATSLELAERVHPGQVVGVDISEALLTRARERSEKVANLRFELADAQTYAFSVDSYDAVFSRFGVMFFSDPTAAFANLRTALRPGGKLGFVCWRTLRENPSFELPFQAVLPLIPDPPPPPVPGAPGPFAFADADRIREILSGAGYTGIDVTPHDTEIVYGGRSDLEGAVDLALQIGPLSRALPMIAESRHAEVRERVTAALSAFHGPSGVKMPAATWMVMARR